MDIKESSIFYNKSKNMYKVDLWFYTRFFDSLIFDNNLINKRYWENKNISSDFKVDKNYILWFSSFFDYKYINIFNLDDFSIKNRIVYDFRLTSFSINWINYYLLIFLDLDFNIWYFTDFEDKMFSLELVNNNFFIKNSIFDSIVFSYSFWFEEIKKNIETKSTLEYSIIDFYYFKDIYNTSFDQNFIEDLVKINIDYLKLNYDFWIVKFEIYNNDKIFLNELNRLFLSINNIQLLTYLPENKEIIEIFSNFENISKLDLKELEFTFQKPTNIFEYDNRYQVFLKNFFKLQYVLYTLKSSYKDIINNNFHSNYYEKLHSLRLDSKKEELEKSIVFFEEKFEKIKKW